MPFNDIMSNRAVIVLLIFLAVIALATGAYLIFSLEKQPTIVQGVYGYVTTTTGNCMPGRHATCSTLPTSATVFAHEATPITAIDASGALLEPRRLIATTRSDSSGYYEIDLPPGSYSLFINSAGRRLCHSFRRHGMCLVQVPNGTIYHDLNLDFSSH